MTKPSHRADAGGPAPHWILAGLSKSISNGSTTSHQSISVIGTHAFGTLRIHDPEQPPMTNLKIREGGSDDDEEGPPPLALPAGEKSAGSHNTSKALLSTESKSPTSQRLSHDLGGGDVVLILGLPEKFIVGYDSISFSAKHFGGVRDIPPGPHFFWVAHPGGLSTRSGFWIVNTGIDTVHVIQWDRFNEVLDEPSRSEARIQAENLGDFYDKLIPYRDPAAVNGLEGELPNTDPEQSLRIWQQLAGCISESVLSRVTGKHVDNWFVHTGDRVHGSFVMAAERELDDSMPGTLFKSSDLNFILSQQAKMFSTQQTGSDRTLEATDSTPYLTSLLKNTENELTAKDLVGEFQFAYLVGMHLGNDACIQQWWYILLKLVIRAYILPNRDASLAADLIRTLTAQISYSTSYLDSSILDYSESQTRDLRLGLIIYKRRLEEFLELDSSPDLMAVGTAFSGLEAIVTKLGWDLRGEYLRRGKVMMEDGEEVELEVTDLEAEDERGEFAPEVVDLDEDGRERGLVSWND